MLLSGRPWEAGGRETGAPYGMSWGQQPPPHTKVEQGHPPGALRAHRGPQRHPQKDPCRVSIFLKLENDPRPAPTPYQTLLETPDSGDFRNL